MKSSDSKDRSRTSPPSSEPAATQASTDPPESGLSPLDFSTFVMSLGSSAMVNLGLIPSPDSDEVVCDLAAAKQMIDILGILDEKTRGNLDDSEKKLLASLLYDLRVKYVDACKK